MDSDSLATMGTRFPSPSHDTVEPRTNTATQRATKTKHKHNISNNSNTIDFAYSSNLTQNQSFDSNHTTAVNTRRNSSSASADLHTLARRLRGLDQWSGLRDVVAVARPGVHVVINVYAGIDGELERIDWGNENTERATIDSANMDRTQASIFGAQKRLVVQKKGGNLRQFVMYELRALLAPWYGLFFHLAGLVGIVGKVFLVLFVVGFVVGIV
ncbi:hypothetical protein GQ44DRAFT_724626 [Phaeosphaeriaceae sp. PMI808]|nr:hypothetical protein GQ44DRAFT_724626 [Phaeosphaeriaceae sp. PMI808]